MHILNFLAQLQGYVDLSKIPRLRFSQKCGICKRECIHEPLYYFYFCFYWRHLSIIMVILLIKNCYIFEIMKIEFELMRQPSSHQRGLQSVKSSSRSNT